MSEHDPVATSVAPFVAPSAAGPVEDPAATPVNKAVTDASFAQSARTKWRGLPLVIGLAALAVAHFPLLTFSPGADRAEGIEGALFEPTTASPGGKPADAGRAVILHRHVSSM